MFGPGFSDVLVGVTEQPPLPQLRAGTVRLSVMSLQFVVAVGTSRSASVLLPSYRAEKSTKASFPQPCSVRVQRCQNTVESSSVSQIVLSLLWNVCQCLQAS